MRAVKRNKNEGRVLKQLKETLTKDKINLTEDMVKFKAIAEIKQKEKEEAEKSEAAVVVDSSMDVDAKASGDGGGKRDKRTLLDGNGQYPSWVNGRQAKRFREIRKASCKKGGVKKTAKSKMLAW